MTKVLGIHELVLISKLPLVVCWFDNFCTYFTSISRVKPNEQYNYCQNFWHQQESKATISENAGFFVRLKCGFTTANASRIGGCKKNAILLHSSDFDAGLFHYEFLG
jgi:hypothetical protein